MSNRVFYALVLVASLGAFACGDDDTDTTGSPTPIPVPGIALMEATGAGPSAEPIDLVGLPGAVAGAGRVSVSADGVETSVRSTAEGSFFATLSAAAGQTIEVRYEASAPAKFVVPAPSEAQSIPESAPLPLSPPEGGQTTVELSSQKGNTPFVVVNLRSGAAVSGTSDAGGELTIQIAAASGDKIRAYILDGALGPYGDFVVS